MTSKRVSFILPKQYGRNYSKLGVMLFDDYEYELYHAFKGPKIAVDEFVHKYSGEISEHGLLNRLYYVMKA